MLAKPRILSLFPNLFNNFNNAWALIHVISSIYSTTTKLNAEYDVGLIEDLD